MTFKNLVYCVPTHMLVMSGSNGNVGVSVHCNM